MEYEEKIEQWFEKYEKENLKFEDLENKFNECKQVSAIIFLASKLKNKTESYFLHGEHDTLYIGSDFDVFEEFTDEDIKIAVYHDLYISDIDGGFQMYASM
jgi:hypothetical protein